MNDQPLDAGQDVQQPDRASRRPYAPPQLVVHGTIQALTESIPGGPGPSGIDDA